MKICTSVKKLHAKCATMASTPRAWSNSKDDDPVTIFLPRVKAYLEYHRTSEEDMVSHAQHFLTGKPFQLWHLYAENLRSKHEILDWSVFTHFMHTSFGAIAPENLARSQNDSLHQSGSVYSYIAEQRKLVQLMKINPAICHSEADIIRQFMRNTKHDLRMYLLDKTPETGYYSKAEEVFSKAIVWQNNQRAKGEVQAAPKQLMTSDNKTSRKGKNKYRSKAGSAKTDYSFNTEMPGGGNRGNGPNKRVKANTPKPAILI